MFSWVGRTAGTLAASASRMKGKTARAARRASGARQKRVDAASRNTGGSDLGSPIHRTFVWYHCVSHLFEHPRLRERGLERRSDPPVGVQGVDPTGGADGGVEETRDRAERIADARRRLAHRHRARGMAAADLGEKWRETNARAAFAFPISTAVFSKRRPSFFDDDDSIQEKTEGSFLDYNRFFLRVLREGWLR